MCTCAGLIFDCAWTLKLRMQMKIQCCRCSEGYLQPNLLYVQARSKQILTGQARKWGGGGGGGKGVCQEVTT